MKDWQILEERVGGTLERQHVWGQRYTDDLVQRYRDTNADGALDEKAYALHDFFHVSALMDGSAVVQERYGYDAFGTPRVMTSAFASSSTSSYTTDFGFGAYRWDKETGLYHVRNRYLHPKLGRWLSRDPIGYRAGVNLYAYARNRSINSIDPSGLGGIPAACVPLVCCAGVAGASCAAICVWGGYWDERGESFLSCFWKCLKATVGKESKLFRETCGAALAACLFKIDPVPPDPEGPPAQPPRPIDPPPWVPPIMQELCPKTADFPNPINGDRVCFYTCPSGKILVGYDVECDENPRYNAV